MYVVICKDHSNEEIGSVIAVCLTRKGAQKVVSKASSERWRTVNPEAEKWWLSWEVLRIPLTFFGFAWRPKK